jgi:hypothetical protein
MQIPHSPLHLTYCTNIHPGETWAEIFANLQAHLPRLKSKLSPDRPFGIGLRLGAIAAEQLLQGRNLAQLQQWLTVHDLYVFTLNGFPYGNFHGQVIKDQVYRPDWTVGDRAHYTQNLIHILATLLPEGIEGSISTLPISYKPWFSGQQDSMAMALNQATGHLANLVALLHSIAQRTGKVIHLGLEPEPDGLIENTEELLAFFNQFLMPRGAKQLQTQLGTPLETAERLLYQHIKVCYDTCHFAVAFESPQEALGRLTQASIGISKIQLSSAIEVEIPQAQTDRRLLQTRLQPFAESTYLHQVVAQHHDGRLQRYRDLDQALPHLLNTQAQRWRTHFHVPIFLEDYGGLKSTQTHLIETLTYIQSHPICQHLEIETYTWDVLPTDLQLDIDTAIEREYRWVLQQLEADRHRLRNIARTIN